MSFYMPGLDDIQEPEPVPDGVYEVELLDAKYITTEKGSRISATVSILNPPDDMPRPPSIYHTLFMASPNAEPWQVQDSALKIKRFLTLFGLPFPGDGFSDDDLEAWLGEWRGKRAKCKVKRVRNDRMDRDENALVVPTLPRRSANAPAGKVSGGLRIA